MGRPGAGTGGSGHSAGGTSRPSGGGGPSGGCLVPAIIILIVIGLLLVFGIGGCSGIPVVSSLFSKNTVQRQPLETSQAYIDDCIISSSICN